MNLFEQRVMQGLWVRLTRVRGRSTQPNYFEPRVTLRIRPVREVHMSSGWFKETVHFETMCNTKNRACG